MEVFSIVPAVADRTMLFLRKTVTAGRSMVSVTGLYVTFTIVTGVITDASTSEVTLVWLQEVVNTISNTNKKLKQEVIFIDILEILMFIE
jgi:hypothetical protein